MKLYSMTSAAALIIGAAAMGTLLNNITDNADSGAELAVQLTSTTTEATTEATTVSVIDAKGLSNDKRSWYFNSNSNHTTPGVQGGIDYKKYSAFYVGDTAQKVIYLTFDEGYENGYSSKILDVLKQKQVNATFFVTESYIKRNPELIKRMHAEGHIVGNHSVRHLSSPTLTDTEFNNEITQTAAAYKAVTGADMPKVFRPPMGEYSERTLALTHNLGYKTIFWSFAYKDWDVNNQPGKTVAYNTIMGKYHNGAIMLLHAVSSSNTEALPQIIDALRAQGYSFGSLDDL